MLIFSPFISTQRRTWHFKLPSPHFSGKLSVHLTAIYISNHSSLDFFFYHSSTYSLSWYFCTHGTSLWPMWLSMPPPFSHESLSLLKHSSFHCTLLQFNLYCLLLGKAELTNIAFSVFKCLHKIKASTIYVTSYGEGRKINVLSSKISWSKHSSVQETRSPLNRHIVEKILNSYLTKPLLI